MEGQTAELSRRLIQLLLDVPAYRRKWKAQAGKRITHAGLNQRAVCAVLAQQALYEGLDYTPSQLKDRVNRALGPRPRGISGDTLRLFITGFAMAPDDAQYLWDATEAGGSGVVLLGTKEFGVPPPKDYRTLTAQEIHQIGPDGIPCEHRTNLVLQATDTLSFYPFITNVEEVAVEPVRGAQTVGKPYRVSPLLSAVNLRFDEPVPQNEIVSLEYITRFLYSSEPPPEFRRGVNSIETLELCVRFHPQYLPTQVWWCTWAGAKGPVISEEPERLRSDWSISRLARNLSGSMVGFRWSFDTLV